jgi:hypothetical protein
MIQNTPQSPSVVTGTQRDPLQECVAEHKAKNVAVELNEGRKRGIASWPQPPHSNHSGVVRRAAREPTVGQADSGSVVGGAIMRKVDSVCGSGR